MSPKTPTIDQLLSAIEKEYLGPDYEYHPHDDVSTDAAWVAPNGVVSSGQPRETHNHNSTQVGPKNYDNLRPSLPKEPYDYLLQPEEMRAIESAFMKTFQVYETMSPKTVADDDTYVYMAPCRDIQSESPQPSNGRCVLIE